MRLMLLAVLSILSACTPSPQKAVMPTPSSLSPADVRDRGRLGSPDNGSGGPVDSAAEALGRRIISTAFVRMGADEYLTVNLHDGRNLVLRDVVMRPNDYCGVEVMGESVGAKYCGEYAEIAAARAGGGPATPNAVEPAPGPAKPR